MTLTNLLVPTYRNRLRTLLGLLDKAEAETSDPDMDASFAQMSKRFHDEGGEFYVPAATKA